MNQKVVFVTGGCSVLGQAIVIFFLENNWRVYATTRSTRKIKQFIQHDNLFYIEMDLEKPRSVDKAIKKVYKQEQNIDVLINNAGFVLAGAFETLTQKQIQREMDVNFFGALHTIKAILPIMKKQQAGCIINISSLCGLVCFPMFSMYHASKWALEGFTESVKYEIEQFGIIIKLIEPGGIKDDKYSSKIEFGENKMSDYDDVFNAVHQNTSWFPGFSSTQKVASIVYSAATDGKSTLRYIIGAESTLFLNERIAGINDESFISKMNKRIFKQKHD